MPSGTPYTTSTRLRAASGHACAVDRVAAVRANAIIAGVNKAGTPWLFVSLSGHEQVAPAAVKETRYFLPARWGRPLEDPSTYDGYFADAPERKVRLPGAPPHSYGGGPPLD